MAGYTAANSGFTPRKSIDVAVGVLVGLRRCSEDEAFKVIAQAVHQTGVPLGDTARALIAMAQADATRSADLPEAPSAGRPPDTHQVQAYWSSIIRAARTP